MELAMLGLIHIGIYVRPHDISQVVSSVCPRVNVREDHRLVLRHIPRNTQKSIYSKGSQIMIHSCTLDLGER